MRYDLRRRLNTIVRTLAELGEADNARALARRIADGTAVSWLRGEHGEHVWAEIGAVATFALRYANHLPADHGTAARLLERAVGEAECLLAEHIPAPAGLPVEHRETLPANVVRLVPRPSSPPRAA